MSAATFDLLDQPWIRARTLDGEEVELSLLGLLDRAHECAGLAGELPTQDFAVTRLLLAVLHRSFPDARGPRDWSTLFAPGRFDMAPITAYVEQHRARFDLLHPRTPFLQVADLSTAKGEMTELGRLVADVPSKFQFFTTRAGDELRRMSFAEAARWLVHCHAFDPSGIKSGALGDERVRGGKGYPIGKGWCGALGCVVVEGGDLFTTLLLNLRLQDRRAHDLPAWEREPATAAAPIRYPTGAVDLLTWQSRRVRLAHDGAQVTGVLIANGDALHQRNTMAVEAMTSWRYSEPQTKAHGNGSPVFMPREHIAGRQVWRGLASLLAEGRPPGAGMGVPRVGGWLDWLDRLREHEAFPELMPLRVRTVAMHYGSQDSVTDDVVADALSLHAATLTQPRLRSLGVAAVGDADTAAGLVARLGGELAEAAGSSGEAVAHHRARARERSYAVLDAPYRRWAAELGPDTDDLARLRWQRTLVRELGPLVTELTRSAGPQAWTGREVSRGPDRTVHLDAGLAELTYRRGLRTAFPGLVAPAPPAPTQEAPA